MTEIKTEKNKESEQLQDQPEDSIALDEFTTESDPFEGTSFSGNKFTIETGGEYTTIVTPNGINFKINVGYDDPQKIEINLKNVAGPPEDSEAYKPNVDAIVTGVGIDQGTPITVATVVKPNGVTYQVVDN